MSKYIVEETNNVIEKKISKADICLFAAIIFICGVGLLLFNIFKKPGLAVEIMISGETVKTVALDETAAYVIYSPDSSEIEDNAASDGDGNSAAGFDASFETDLENTENYVVDGKTICIVKCNTDGAESTIYVDSYNVMIIEDNCVNIIDADCPDKVCVNHSSIGNVGETIICLPHKLVVEISEN